MEQLRLLDALRARFGSDSAAATQIGISRQAVSLLRKNNRADDSTICKACALLVINPGPSLALHRADLTDDPATRSAWANVARQLSAADSAPGNDVPPESNSAPPNALASPTDTPPSDLYYVKSQGAKNSQDAYQCQNAVTMLTEYHINNSTNTPDMFGQITITAADVVAWVSTIPAYPPCIGTDRWAKYVADYNVLEKIASAKKSRRFGEILDRAPLATVEEVETAAAALIPVFARFQARNNTSTPTYQTAPAPSLATSAPSRLSGIAALRVPMASTTLADAFIPLPLAKAA